TLCPGERANVQLKIWKILRSRLRARVRIPALVSAGLIGVVALGAANYGGVHAAPPDRRRTRRHMHRPSIPNGSLGFSSCD
ncbi:MAG TPA: hypothetical protein VF221_20215, partial [Chloroflexota bacterium]